MLMTRQEFEQLTYDICKSETEWAARFALLRHFDHADRRAFLAECARNTAQLKVEEQAENFQKQAKELRDALARFAKIDLTSPSGNDIAWDILNARAALEAK